MWEPYINIAIQTLTSISCIFKSNSIICLNGQIDAFSGSFW